MKKSKKLFLTIVSIIIVVATFTGTISAVSTNFSSFITIPSDIGEVLDMPTVNNDDTVHKYYLVINIYNVVDTSYSYSINYSFHYNQTLETSSKEIVINNTNFQIGYISFNSNTGFLYMPTIGVSSNYYARYRFYIPIYLRNASIDSITYDTNICDIYICDSTSDDNTIASEAFQLGYNIGYNEGYEDGIPAGAEILENLNFVENIEMLIGKFTGDEYAKYITPIAIVLAILLVYFIFIRFLLSLIKAKGVIKVCDIVTLVACISILVVMYLPMIDFTITQHQLVEQIYSVAADVTP